MVDGWKGGSLEHAEGEVLQSTVHSTFCSNHLISSQPLPHREMAVQEPVVPKASLIPCLFTKHSLGGSASAALATEGFANSRLPGGLPTIFSFPAGSACFVVRGLPGSRGAQLGSNFPFERHKEAWRGEGCCW